MYADQPSSRGIKRKERIRSTQTKEDKKESKDMNKGGSVSAYAKGGMVKANCGASVPPAQKKK